MKRRIERLDGHWWWRAGRKYPGVLETDFGSRATLRLNGRFPGFQSYEPGGRGARSARQVVRGRTADGRDFTLVDCVETSTSRSLGRPQSERASYSASWYIEGAHFATFGDIAFTQIALSCDYLNELVGETFICPTYSEGRRGFQLSYESPAPLIAEIGDFRLELSQGVPFQFSTRFHVIETAEAAIKAKQALPFDVLWDGPVANIRSLFDFMTEMRLSLRYVNAAYGSQRPRWCRIFGFGEAARNPKQLSDHPVRQFLFTARALSEPSWQEVLAAWVRVRDQLLPVWALYSAATTELTLYGELRFLALAQALETYHRTQFKEKQVPSDEHKRRKKRVLAALNASDREWVKNALAWSNELTLRQRLERLYEQIPRPLIDHMPELRVLVRQISDTRNYLTHFGERKTHVLRGFRLLETTDNMRQALQYLLLLELGFSPPEAGDIAHRSFVRDLSRARVVRSMGTS